MFHETLMSTCWGKRREGRRPKVWASVVSPRAHGVTQRKKNSQHSLLIILTYQSHLNPLQFKHIGKVCPSSFVQVRPHLPGVSRYHEDAGLSRGDQWGRF